MKRREAGGEREVVLLEAGTADLSFDQIAAHCEERVRALVDEACRWRSNGHGRTWKPGDYNILIFETTAAVGAVLYVQFWSEPMAPVEWEVSSGRANQGALPFVGDQAQERLRGLGFEIGGGAENFRKQVTIANAGDVQAVARQALRIFVEALGYRGRTPLVARIGHHTHAQAAWVYRSVSADDVQKMLWHAGRRAQKGQPGKYPVLDVENDGLKYGAILYDAAGDERFQSVDLRIYLGRIRQSGLRPLNAVNANYRSIKGYMDEDRDAWVVATVSFDGGITEDAFRVQVELFERALRDPAFASLARSVERTDRRQKREAEARKGEGAVVH